MTSNTCVVNPKTRARVAAAARRGIIAGIPCTGYTMTFDTFASSPYVIIELGRGMNLHHATETAAARRIARARWGELADVIRLSAGRYEAVWCGLDPVIPEWADARYGQYQTRGLADL